MASQVESPRSTQVRRVRLGATLTAAALMLAACGISGSEASSATQAPASISENATTDVPVTNDGETATTPPTTATGDAPVPPTTATTIPTTTAASAPPATTSLEGIAENGFPVIKYFEASQRICDAYAASVGNGPPNPERYVGATIDSQLDEYRTLIVDGTGSRFVVNIEEQPPTIALEDATAALPFDLSFGCPPELYVGFIHD